MSRPQQHLHTDLISQTKLKRGPKKSRYNFEIIVFRTILVYDLGGGTFDVSIVEMKGTEADVKSTRGLTFLGGEDFDYRIYEEAVAEFKVMGE